MSAFIEICNNPPAIDFAPDNAISRFWKHDFNLFSLSEQIPVYSLDLSYVYNSWFNLF
ncbi:MAG: hypothetical protein PF689_12585 [Deltaproteobacteria bacterium]|nr:hypothetical protein [Deltaproteobacteria bacterium]